VKEGKWKDGGDDNDDNLVASKIDRWQCLTLSEYLNASLISGLSVAAFDRVNF
jgi:hypothetical protein